MLINFLNLLLNRKVLWASLLVWHWASAQTALDNKAVEGLSLSNTEVSAFVSNEKQALDGLRNGTTRLERLCATPLKPLPAKTGTQALDELREQMQERAQRIGASAERSVSLTQFALTTAQQNSQQACSPVNRIKSLWLKPTPEAPTCESTKQQLEVLSNLNKAAKDWLAIHQERQRLFTQLIQLESAGCTRSGFAQRMVQTHERALAPFEAQALELFESALRKEAPTAASKP